MVEMACDRGVVGELLEQVKKSGEGMYEAWIGLLNGFIDQGKWIGGSGLPRLCVVQLMD